MSASVAVDGGRRLIARNLAKAYGTRTVVRDLSLEVGAGEIIGLLGPNGAGKTTAFYMIVGLVPADAGRILLDELDLTHEPIHRRARAGIGYLPQDIEIFPGTVASNIARFGEVDPQQVVEAAQLAGAHAMILSLPQGYDTPIGPDGANLSGGQRQRIGLARAFYGGPPLIVLDEPTSNLDAEGETAVRQAIDQLKRAGSTVLVIAHRPALLGGTDQLMVIVQGRVANLGATAEVMPAITRRVVVQPEAGPRSTEIAARGGGHD